MTQLHPSKRLRDIEQEMRRLVFELKQIGETRTPTEWQREVILKQVVPAIDEALNELGGML